MNEVRFSVRIKVKDMFLFLLQHSYRGASLIVDVLITAGAVALLLMGFGKDNPVKTVALLFLALLFTLFYPVQLYLRAKKQVAGNAVFQEPLDYVLNDEGITMSQGEASESFAWSDVFRIKETRSLLMVYTGRVYACVWPKRELSACEPQVRELFRKHLTPKVAGRSIKKQG